MLDKSIKKMEGQHKILVADDDDDILEFIRYNLEKHDYIVITASNGKEAIEKAEQENPNLIILDIMMSEMDGVEVCRYLRTQPKFKKTIITFLTARSEDFTQIAALDVGGDDFIKKPIRPGVLVSRINALLRRTNREVDEAGDNIIQHGNLLIDREKVLVQKDGLTIDLAKKEFELITLLLSRPGKVYTREEIFKKIWGADVIVGNRTIDVHIRKLREKLGDEYIKTVKGVGYKIAIA